MIAWFSDLSFSFAIHRKIMVNKRAEKCLTRLLLHTLPLFLSRPWRKYLKGESR